MEQKHVILSALGVGVGVGVGVGLGTIGKWAVDSGAWPSVLTSSVVTADEIEKELLRQVVDGRDCGITFDQFPYYLGEQTRELLTSAAYVHLKHAEVSKYTRNLSPASRTILLSGPAELYQQMLAKALSQYFEAKLLLLDATDFSLRMQSRYKSAGNESGFRRSTSESTLERLSTLIGSFQFGKPEGSKGALQRQHSGVDFVTLENSRNSDPPKLRRNASASANISNLATQSTTTAPLKRSSSWSFDEKLLMVSLYKVLTYVCKTNPIVLYIRDAEKLLFRSQRAYSFFQKMVKKLSGPVLILGSRIVDLESENKDLDKRLSAVFPYNIEIRPPEEESHLVSWKTQLEEDMKRIQVKDNRNHIIEILSSNDLDCDDLESICIEDTMVLSNFIEEIVVSALSYHLMNNKELEYRNGKLVISSKSLSHGLSIFQKAKSDLKKTTAQQEEKGNGKSETSKHKKNEDVKEASSDNEFEKRIRPDVIPASEINVNFEDIGALEKVKDSLQELVMLPLRRPDLFNGGLLKPCRGILLFGPPGTGKTMMAKAIAKESGASFINVSMSTITSKWFGEDEKNVKALFSLAAKVAPTIIFVDEVDSMLGQRSGVGEHEAMRKLKNEFMTHWDGLLTKPGERILVLAATNRPFDLDEAIIRRFERRIMVGLPSAQSREKILEKLIAKEKIEQGLDCKQIAAMTEGYTGSDLKNLCITAAYRPIRELIQQERQKNMVSKGGALTVSANVDKPLGDPDKAIDLRPLSMEDFRVAKSQVAASFASEGCMMTHLQKWNTLYGEGGSRKVPQLSYFL